MEGWLSKKGSGLLGGWQRRYFRLTHYQLSYSEKAEDKTAKEVIDLRTTKQILTDQFQSPLEFELITVKKSMHLKAHTAEELNQWLNLLTVFNSASSQIQNNDLTTVKIPIPAVLSDGILVCLNYFLSHTSELVSTEGIFRTGGNHSTVNHYYKLILANNASNVFSSSTHSSVDVHDVSSLLKRLLRELPETLFTNQLFDSFTQAHVQDNEHGPIQPKVLRNLIQSLPQPNKELIEKLFLVCSIVIEGSSGTKMDSKNLSICLGPNLARRDVQAGFLLDLAPLLNSAKQNKEYILAETIAQVSAQQQKLAQSASSATAAASTTTGRSRLMINTQAESTDNDQSGAPAPLSPRSAATAADVVAAVDFHRRQSLSAKSPSRLPPPIAGSQAPTTPLSAKPAHSPSTSALAHNSPSISTISLSPGPQPMIPARPPPMNTIAEQPPIPTAGAHRNQPVPFTLTPPMIPTQPPSSQGNAGSNPNNNSNSQRGSQSNSRRSSLSRNDTHGTGGSSLAPSLPQKLQNSRSNSVRHSPNNEPADPNDDDFDDNNDSMMPIQSDPASSLIPPPSSFGLQPLLSPSSVSAKSMSSLLSSASKPQLNRTGSSAAPSKHSSNTNTRQSNKSITHDSHSHSHSDDTESDLSEYVDRRPPNIQRAQTMAPRSQLHQQVQKPQQIALDDSLPDVDDIIFGSNDVLPIDGELNLSDTEDEPKSKSANQAFKQALQAKKTGQPLNQANKPNTTTAAPANTNANNSSSAKPSSSSSAAGAAKKKPVGGTDSDDDDTWNVSDTESEDLSIRDPVVNQNQNQNQNQKPVKPATQAGNANSNTNNTAASNPPTAAANSKPKRARFDVSPPKLPAPGDSKQQKVVNQSKPLAHSDDDSLLDSTNDDESIRETKPNPPIQPQKQHESSAIQSQKPVTKPKIQSDDDDDSLLDSVNDESVRETKPSTQTAIKPQPAQPQPQLQQAPTQSKPAAPASAAPASAKPTLTVPQTKGSRSPAHDLSDLSDLPSNVDLTFSQDSEFDVDVSELSEREMKSSKPVQKSTVSLPTVNETHTQLSNNKSQPNQPLTQPQIKPANVKYSDSSSPELNLSVDLSESITESWDESAGTNNATNSAAANSKAKQARFDIQPPKLPEPRDSKQPTSVNQPKPSNRLAPPNDDSLLDSTIDDESIRETKPTKPLVQAQKQPQTSSAQSQKPIAKPKIQQHDDDDDSLLDSVMDDESVRETKPITQAQPSIKPQPQSQPQSQVQPAAAASQLKVTVPTAGTRPTLTVPQPKGPRSPAHDLSDLDLPSNVDLTFSQDSEFDVSELSEREVKSTGIKPTQKSTAPLPTVNETHNQESNNKSQPQPTQTVTQPQSRPNVNVKPTDNSSPELNLSVDLSESITESWDESSGNNNNNNNPAQQQSKAVNQQPQPVPTASSAPIAVKQNNQAQQIQSTSSVPVQQFQPQSTAANINNNVKPQINSNLAVPPHVKRTVVNAENSNEFSLEELPSLHFSELSTSFDVDQHAALDTTREINQQNQLQQQEERPKQTISQPVKSISTTAPSQPASAVNIDSFKHNAESAASESARISDLLSKLQSLAAERDAERVKFNSQLNELRSAHSAQRSQIELALSELHKTKSHDSQASVELNQLKSELDALKSIHSNELQSQQALIQKQQNIIQSQSSDLSQAQIQCAELKSQFTHLKSQLDDKQLSIQMLENDLKQEKLMRTHFESEYQSTLTELNKLRNQPNNANANNSNTGSLSELIASRNELLVKSAQFDHEKSQLIDRNNILELQNRTIQTEFNEINQKFTQLELSHERLMLQANSQKQSIEFYQNTIAALESQLEQQRKAAQSMESNQSDIIRSLNTKLLAAQAQLEIRGDSESGGQGQGSVHSEFEEKVESSNSDALIQRLSTRLGGSTSNLFTTPSGHNRRSSLAASKRKLREFELRNSQAAIESSRKLNLLELEYPDQSSADINSFSQILMKQMAEGKYPLGNVGDHS